MADKSKTTDGPTPFDAAAFDYTKLPDWDNDFVDQEGIAAFVRALGGPENVVSTQEDGAASPADFITALNDWRPIHQRVRRIGPLKRKKKRKPPRGIDETREGYFYTIFKWPMLILVLAWLIVLSAAYALVRIYIFLYEHFVTMRGRRQRIREKLHKSASYADWVAAAKEMDRYLGNDKWKETDDYAYYNSDTVRSVRDELFRLRRQVEKFQPSRPSANPDRETATRVADDLRALVEASAKNNFVGVENPRLYSESYYGTKDLVQSFIDEVEKSMQTLSSTSLLSNQEKASMFAHLSRNFGRTALCLSGGATFAYYHFGVAKALLDAGILPNIITGTSGGALVAALLATRTDEELKQLIVPALAHRITACEESFIVWMRRWWRTGARFDSVSWARKCSWFCYGSLTFKEAYERTGRVLNVTCIPSDPHSPTVLANYLTAPDCVVWSAVLASAAVPGILNPVVLMKKNARTGRLEPYSFGHKWKDGSLRTDIPLRALNTHFNVNFSVVSQVNPHINLFFFSSRGTVGRPVTHRRGRGWRGGFLGSAAEQYLKLDLYKWLKVMRHLELLPRFVGQDWSEIWLQRFSGTVTIWPKSIASDFVNILSDPNPERLARMIHVGQLSCFPKLKFIANRIKVERLIEAGAKEFPLTDLRAARPQLRNMLSEEDLEDLLTEARRRNGRPQQLTPKKPETLITLPSPSTAQGAPPSIGERLSRWWSPSSAGSPSSPRRKRWSFSTATTSRQQQQQEQQQSQTEDRDTHPESRRGSVMAEIGRQSRVFIDDSDSEGSASAEASTEAEADEHTTDDEVAAPAVVPLEPDLDLRAEASGG